MDALIALYNATDGDSWENNSNWLSDEPIGTWHGVTANTDGRVENIALKDNGLAGVLPKELGNLTELRQLFLRGNRLTGSIPADLGNLPDLGGLDLADNALTGAIPPELGEFARLEVLDLSGNQLSGPIPAEIGKLARLQRLLLDENAFTGQIPAQLFAIPFLNILSIRDNDLSGTIPSEIENAVNLRRFVVGSNQLSGQIPPQLGSLAKLEYLSLRRNQFSGQIPAELGGLRELKSLSLGQNQLSGQIPAEFGGLTELKSLSLGHNQLSGPIPPQLGNLALLTWLTLNSNRLNGSIPPQLGQMTMMRTLLLNGNQLSGPIPAQLSGMANLDWIYLGGNRLGGCLPSSWRGVRENDLASLNLGFCSFGLPGLNVSPGLLDPPFASNHYRYALRVGIDVESITIQPNAGSAAVDYLNLAGEAVPDADPRRSGHQIALVGTRTDLDIRVSANAQQVTYRLEIARGFPFPVTVNDNEYFQAPGNEDLKHNIPDLNVVIDGQALKADFLTHFRNTGNIRRWGFPTSEVLVLENRSLTQFYQRGVVDFHDVGAGWVLERRLAWDYIGGGLGGNPDLGVEAGVVNPHPGTISGPWGHKVSDQAIDGTRTGFADFYQQLGGIAAFGFAKTDARQDTNADGTLHVAGYAPGFIRQYFQSAVLEYHPNDANFPVKISLIGDDLRQLLVPTFQNEPGFAAAQPLTKGAAYDPPTIGLAAEAGTPAGETQPPPGGELGPLALQPSVTFVETAGYTTGGDGLAKVTVHIANHGSGWGGPFPVGLVNNTDIPPGQDLAAAIGSLAVCSETIQTGCRHEGLTDGFIAPGGSKSVLLSLVLPVGLHAVTLFAGDPVDGDRWGPNHLQPANIEVPPQPPDKLFLDVGADIAGYWSDGDASVDIVTSLSNAGSQRLSSPQSVVIECLLGGVALAGCGGSYDVVLDNGLGTKELISQVRVPSGSNLEFTAAVSPLPKKSVLLDVPQKILGVDREIWVCFSDRPGDPSKSGCGGWYKPKIQKWDDSRPVKIWATGRADYIALLEDVVGEMASILGLEFEFVDSQDQADVSAYVGVPSSTAGELGWIGCADFAGCATWSNKDDVTYAGTFGVWDQGPVADDPVSVKGVTIHELLHVMVPIGHRHTADHLLGRGGRISRSDEALIRLNSHRLVLPGMTMDEVEQLIVFSDELLDPPRLDVYTRIRRATLALLEAGSAQYELKGRWSGSGCGAVGYGWAEYQIGEFTDDRVGLAHFFDNALDHLWFVDGAYWAILSGGWAEVDYQRFFNELGWLNGFSDPIEKLSNVIGYGRAENFEITAQQDGKTVLEATEVPVRSSWALRDFTITIDDETGVITDYGWTHRSDGAVCFLRIEARNGEYGIEIQLPETIAQGR